MSARGLGAGAADLRVGVLPGQVGRVHLGAGVPRAAGAARHPRLTPKSEADTGARRTTDMFPSRGLLRAAGE